MMYASCLPWDEHTNFRLLFIDLVLPGAVHLSLVLLCTACTLAIVAIVFPYSCSRHPFQFSDFGQRLPRCCRLVSVEEESREGKGEAKNIRKPKQNSRKTKLHFLQLEKFFASRLESCNNSNIMGSNITGKGCVRFCVVVRFGSSSSSSSSCCCCRSVCCLLVRISKSFIIILWH